MMLPFDPTILHDTSDAAVTAAYEGVWADLIRTFGRAPHVELHDEPGILWFITGMRSDGMNGVQQVRLAEPDVAPTIARVHARFRERGVGCGWLLSSNTQPPNLAEHLRAAGLRNVASLPGMRFDLYTMPSTVPHARGLTIEPVRDTDHLAAWNEAEARGFEVDAATAAGYAAIRNGIGLDHGLPLTRFLARLNGLPVATSTVLLSAGVAGIFDVATVPHARHRGIGAAVTHAALRYARERGYRTAVLQPSDMGAPMYTRLGFRQFVSFSVYV